jgi:citrate lyase subunit beta/citryl-CoA lyase
VLATSALVRRSVLVVPVTEPAAVADAWRYDADAVALELPGGYELRGRSAAWARVAEAAEHAGRGGAEVFVRIDRAIAYADIRAAVVPGVNGVVLPNAEWSAEVGQVADMLGEREREVGLPAGELEIVLVLGTARGIWNVRELVNASPRVASVAIDEARLARSMGIAPSPDFDPLSFARGRVIVETLALAKLPLGIGHPLGALQRAQVDPDEFSRLAERARNTGFKGAFCPFPSWVAGCNKAFTPSDEQVAYSREVRQAFAKGVARGTAAVPFPGGRMIDVPVDERAKLVIDLWERCQRRDAEKAAAGRRLL